MGHELSKVAEDDGNAPPCLGSESSVIAFIRILNKMAPALGAAPRPVASKAIVQMLLHYTGIKIVASTSVNYDTVLSRHLEWYGDA